MNKKHAIKVLSATAVAATAFVATSPADASVQTDAQKLVNQAKNAGTVLKWAISTEGSADGTTRPWAQYNAAKAARDKAVAAVNKLPASQKAGYLADLEANVNLHITRAMYYIDAITAGEKIKAKQDVLSAQIAKGAINDATEAAYHELSKEIRKQAVLLDRVYGKSTRDEIRGQYKQAAEAVRDSALYAVTVKMELDLAADALENNKTAEVEKHLAEANKYIGQVKNAAMKATLTKVLGEIEAQLTPAVKSVSAVNATQLVVTFNKEIDAADATAAKFTLEGQLAPTVKVAEDNKTVTLTFASVEGTNKVVTVEPIKTKADAKVTTERHVSQLTYTDTVDPTIAGVDYKYTGSNTATAVITFSEPLSAAGTVSVNGSVVSPTIDLAAGTISLAGLEVGKAYKVDVVGATDKGGNIANPIVQNFTVPAAVKDEVKPVAAVSVSGNKVTLNFSEEVSTLGTVTINGKDYAADFVKDANDKTKYVLDAQKAGALTGVTFLNTTVTVDGFKDNAGNQGEKVQSAATLQADKTAPAFVSATVNAANSKLLVTFNDEVEAGDLTAANELNLKVLDNVYKTGSVTDLTDLNAKFGFDVDGNGKVEGTENNVLAIDYTFTPKSTYTFELAGKVAADVYGNQVSDTLTFTVTAPDTTTAPVDPKADVAFGEVTVNGSVITVPFNKEMSNTALDASNYKLGGKVLPNTTAVKFVGDRKTVEITLPEGFVTANGTYVLEATNLTDKDSNTLANAKATASLTVKENVAPTVTGVTATDSKNLTVNFSETIANNSDVKGVTVKVNGTAVAATATAVNGKLSIVTANNFNLSDSVTVEFKSANIVDANGNTVKDATIAK
ncbi:S-layer homology domain-containing protein [Bacillus infantis]|uniref:S-layer homology domain-containing protein n=1 Tax=Bacillus infantis TaxID=324767 RepID=A0A5D4SP39_9BACI|nr:S-layer homology domain-containing protein [Bacillus infantis]TYS63968.1 S-layer homology domain-containing protein [Bacillus infantis]